MKIEGSAAEHLSTLKNSKKMAEIMSSLEYAKSTGASIALILNETLGSIREAVLIVTILRVYHSYEVTFCGEGITVKL